MVQLSDDVGVAEAVGGPRATTGVACVRTPRPLAGLGRGGGVR